MNTRQLIVLWYVGFVVLLLLANDGLGIRELRSNESARIALIAILFGALVMFTQRSDLQFDKKLFFKWMSVPAIILLGLIAIVVNREMTRGNEGAQAAQYSGSATSDNPKLDFSQYAVEEKQRGDKSKRKVSGELPPDDLVSPPLSPEEWEKQQQRGRAK